MALRTIDFDFDLPESLIAQHPVTPRDSARLLHVAGNTLSDHVVTDLPHFLKEGDVMVFNDTKVIPARLMGHRHDITGGKVEILLHQFLPQENDHVYWNAFARPAKRLKTGDTLFFADDFYAIVQHKNDDGTIRVSFPYTYSHFLTLLQQYGQMPLPPYIKRAEGPTQNDSTQYQTIYARANGAVAAPTAGLHFTPALLQKITDMGVHIVHVTLHVGAGTFLPVKADYLHDHTMHAEWGEISPDTAAVINTAKKEGRRIVAVGTTSLRLLESAAQSNGVVQDFCAETRIFIYPGYQFNIVDVLMTNFHLPKSTLFMLVSAFCGQDEMRAAYAHAIQNGYRFFSYGDSSLLERKKTD